MRIPLLWSLWKRKRQILTFPAFLAARTGAVTAGSVNHLYALEPYKLQYVRLGPGSTSCGKQKWQEDQVLEEVVLVAPPLPTVSGADSTNHSAESFVSAIVLSSPEQSTDVTLCIFPGCLVLTLVLQPRSLYYELPNIF